MQNYYVSLGLDQSAKTEDIHGILVSMRKKWVQRANMASNPTDRSEAELKVALIRDAIQIFSDEGARRQYDFELNNQEADYTQPEQEEVIDEVYKKNLASADAFFEEKEYGNALALAQNMLNAGNKTARVYEIAMLCLHNTKRYDDALQMGITAINEDGLEDTKVYRVFAFACEAKNNPSLAHRYLVQLKQNRPDDVNVDYLIANQFMNHFDGKFLVEARDYIDVLLERTNLQNSPEIAEWDVRCELRQGHLPLVIAKIAAYLSGDSIRNDEFYQNSLSSFISLLEEYVTSNYSKVQDYIKQSDESSSTDNRICGEKIAVWDIAYTLEKASDITSDWYNIVEKYKARRISSACYTVIKKHAKQCVRQLPTYSILTELKLQSLTTENDKDYFGVSNILNSLSEILSKSSASDSSVSGMINEVDGIHNYVQYERRLKPLKIIRIFTRTYWCVFIFPLLTLLSVTLLERFSSPSDLQEFWQGLSQAEPWKPLIIAGCYIFILWIIALGLVQSAIQRRKKRGQKTGGLTFVFILLFIVIYPGMGVITPIIQTVGEEKVMDFLSSANENLGFFESVFNSCYDIVSGQPMMSGIIALAIFVFGCVIGSKIKKVKQGMNAINFGSVLANWITD